MMMMTYEVGHQNIPSVCEFSFPFVKSEDPLLPTCQTVCPPLPYRHWANESLPRHWNRRYRRPWIDSVHTTVLFVVFVSSSSSAADLEWMESVAHTATANKKTLESISQLDWANKATKGRIWDGSERRGKRQGRDNVSLPFRPSCRVLRANGAWRWLTFPLFALRAVQISKPTHYSTKKRRGSFHLLIPTDKKKKIGSPQLTWGVNEARRGSAARGKKRGVWGERPNSQSGFL